MPTCVRRRAVFAYDTESIVDFLMRSGHVVSEIHKNRIGLEEYYIELMKRKEV